MKEYNQDAPVLQWSRAYRGISTSAALALTGNAENTSFKGGNPPAEDPIATVKKS